MRSEILDGYFDKEGNLYIDVTNIAEFNELLRKAQVQTHELQKTISDLSIFKLKIEFKVNK